MLDMAKRRTKRKRKVPEDDMQKTINGNFEATTHSFEGATKVTQEIASRIVDYSKRSLGSPETEE
jgi:hypothetical protein